MNWRTDRFTAMPERAESARSACQRAACVQAVSSTQRPIGSIMPVSSATGMKSAGAGVPRAGCSQRSSASTEAIEESRSETIGW